MRPFNKTTATLVRPHPFSTLCPTPLGKSPVWIVIQIIACLEAYTAHNKTFWWGERVLHRSAAYFI